MNMRFEHEPVNKNQIVEIAPGVFARDTSIATETNPATIERVIEMARSLFGDKFAKWVENYYSSDLPKTK